MSSLSVSDVLRNNGFPPMSEPSGLTKNMRKRRNKKIKRAAVQGGLSILLSSGDFNEYINPARLGKKVKPIRAQTRVSYAPGISGTELGSSGGWGRLPNTSRIDYAPDDSNGWERQGVKRRCMIQDD